MFTLLMNALADIGDARIYIYKYKFLLVDITVLYYVMLCCVISVMHFQFTT